MRPIVMTNTGSSFELGSSPYISGDDLCRFMERGRWMQIDVASHMGKNVRTVRRWMKLGSAPIPDVCVSREIAFLIAEGAVVQQMPASMSSR